MSQTFESKAKTLAGKQALEWIGRMMDQTVQPEVVILRYGQTSELYEQNMANLNYSGAVETGLALAKLFPTNREVVNILDIAAGTGLCAVEFTKYGFRKMDALEPSADMIKLAKQKGLYKHFINNILADSRLEIADDTYDAVTMSSFCTNVLAKLPMKSFEEIIRIVKPGGYVVNTGFFTTFVGEEVQTEDFRRKIRTLESQGKWKEVEIKRFKEYLFGKDGAVSVHEIC